MSRSLPVYKNSFFGSTPGSIVGPLLREYSRKSGPTLCFFIMGVLPEALQHFCGSTPAKSGYLQRIWTSAHWECDPYECSSWTYDGPRFRPGRGILN